MIPASWDLRLQLLPGFSKHMNLQIFNKFNDYSHINSNWYELRNVCNGFGVLSSTTGVPTSALCYKVDRLIKS